MDARLDELGSTFKTTRRRELCYEIQTILSDELPIFLVHDMKMVGVNNDFYNFKLTPHLSITGDSYCLESVEYDKTVSAEVNSPYGVSFTDNLGRRTGYFNESVYEDIPKSTYTGIDSDPQIIRIRSPEGNFSCQVFPKEGAGYVSFSVELCFISDTFKDPKILNGAVSNDVVYEYSDYHGRDRIDIRKDVIFYECDFRVDPDGSIFIYDSWHIPDSTLLFSALIYDEHRYGLTYEIALVIFCQNPRMRPGRWIIDIS